MRLHDSRWLRDQARRCSRLAETTTDERTAKTLKLMALEYEREAVTIDTTIIAEPIVDDVAKPPLDE